MSVSSSEAKRSMISRGVFAVGRRRVNISVSSEALNLLDRLQQRTGLNRSALVELLVREEAVRRRIGRPRRRSDKGR